MTVTLQKDIDGHSCAVRKACKRNAKHKGGKDGAVGKKKNVAVVQDNVAADGYILFPDNVQQLLHFFSEFMQVVTTNVEYYVTTQGGKKKRIFNGKKYVRTFAAYMVYYRFFAPFDLEGFADEKVLKNRLRPDGITGRDSLCEVKGLQHPGRRSVIFELISALDSKFPFLRQMTEGEKETPHCFYTFEKFGTTCQSLRTKFRNNPIWFSNGYTFDTAEQRGLPASWKCYLKALGFPLGPGAYELDEDCEHNSFVNRRS